jgi:hypothetical protein
VATAGHDLESLLLEMKASHSSGAAKRAAAGAANHGGSSRG